jgi:structural maintenance of chromosome 1
MDAISFVLGVRTTHLRSSNLADLLYRAPGAASVQPNGHVSLVYEDEDEGVIVFTRAIRFRDGKANSEYSINKKAVSAEAYDEKLQSFGILGKARNFLVFQVWLELNREDDLILTNWHRVMLNLLLPNHPRN